MTQLTTLSGATLSKLCFGAMQFGTPADAEMSRAMYDACRAAGINFFDTAHCYTGGQSETLLGGCVAPERNKVFVATKVGYAGGASAQNLRAQFEECQARLRIDCVDLLYLHRWDGETALEETISALVELQASGRTRFIGLSNFAAWQVMKAQTLAQAMGSRIDVLQPMYNLVKRQAEVEILPMALDQQIAVVPYSPLGGGLLTGKYVSAAAHGRLVSDPRYAARYGEAAMHDTAKALQSFAKERGINPATLAILWAAAHPGVTAPIISARNVDQLHASLAALEVTLSDDDHAALSDMSATPPPATDRLEEQIQNL